METREKDSSEDFWAQKFHLIDFPKLFFLKLYETKDSYQVLVAFFFLCFFYFENN